MKITDRHIFSTLSKIEGPRWAATDQRGGPNSLTGLIKVRSEYEALKDEYGPFDGEIAQCLGHSGVVYGESGWSRYVLRGEELVLDGSSTHTDKIAKARAEGIRVLT